MSIDWFAHWTFIIVLSIIDAVWLWKEGIQTDAGPMPEQCRAVGIVLALGVALTIVGFVAKERRRLRFVALVLVDFT